MTDPVPDPSTTTTATTAITTTTVETAAAGAPATPDARTPRDARVVAACVIVLGLAVAGLLVWKAATDSPSGPSSDTTATTAAAADGPTG